MASAPIFSGCGTALVTPFRQDLALDEQALRRLVRRQVDAGISFLVPCGTTGENPTLSHEEHLRVVEITLEEAAGRVPVLAGCGGNNTASVIAKGRERGIGREEFEAGHAIEPQRADDVAADWAQ